MPSLFFYVKKTLVVENARNISCFCYNIAVVKEYTRYFGDSVISLWNMPSDDYH